MTLWLARHAPVTVSGVCYGQTDVPTRLCAEEAAAVILDNLRMTLASCPPPAPGVDSITEVWSSPFRRSREVAAVLSRSLQVSHYVDARISELSFGDWEGRPFFTIESEEPEAFHTWVRDYESLAPPGGETARQLRGRVTEFLEERRASSACALAVTHAGVIRVARALRDGRPDLDFATPIPHLVPERIL